MLRPMIVGALMFGMVTLNVLPSYAADRVELYFALMRPQAEAFARMGGILTALGGQVRDSHLAASRTLIATKFSDTQFLWEVTFMEARTAGKPSADMRLFCSTTLEPAEPFCERIQELYLQDSNR